MKSKSVRKVGQEGSVIILALLMLAFLSIIGVTAATTAQIETQIASNERFSKIAFFNADSGIHATPKLISAFIDNAGPTAAGSGISFLNDSGVPNAGDDTLDDVFYYEIMGYDDLLGRDAHDSTNDMTFTMGGDSVEVDIERAGQQSLAGGGVEFATGADGVGSGSGGGVAIFYAMDSHGDGPVTSQANISGVYRKVVGVAGGM